MADATKLLFSTSNNFQKILTNGSTTITVPADSGVIPIVYTAFTLATHGLGYIPTARVFFEYPSGQLWPVQSDSNMNPILGRYYLTTNTLVLEAVSFTGSNESVKVYYRIYSDASH
jgi:hypothetical protein